MFQYIENIESFQYIEQIIQYIEQIAHLTRVELNNQLLRRFCSIFTADYHSIY